MTYFKLRILILLITMTVSSYYLFKFFSRLSGVNMSSAAALAFRLDSHVPVLHRVAAFLGFFMFLCIIMALLLYIETPKKISDLEKYHAGGLLGYHTGDMHTKLYDPAEGVYKDYYVWGGPPVPEKFTETFDKVLLFKSPSQEYYEYASRSGFAGNIAALVVILILTAATYIFLFLMAEFYNQYNGIDVKPDHRVIAENFREITGMPWWKAAIIIFSVLLIISIISSIWATVLNHRYTKQYIPEQQLMKTRLLEKVRPGDTLRGKVLVRFKESVEDSSTGETLRGTRTKRSYYTVMHYTVEFPELLHVPVYLAVPLYPGSAESELLEKPFTKKYSAEPEYAKEYSFIVNKDYSVSLKMDR